MPQANYGGTTILGAPGTPHLGGNVKEGDPYTFAPRVWNYVIERFCINSLLDVGSGIGNAAEYFFRKGIRTIAIEGMLDNVRAAQYPTIGHDLTQGPITTTHVDLVHCQEVVEHIEERFLPNVLDSFACGRLILMTHALPGQTGHHHVNLQPDEYWVKHVGSRGYNLLIEDTQRIRNLAASEGAIYLQQSGLLFHRK